MSDSTSVLIIRHVSQRTFVVSHQSDGKSSSPVELTAPDALRVEGRPQTHLLGDLRWYLERFLAYPLEPNPDLAMRIQRTLADWGRSTFERLFGGQALLWYCEIRKTGLENLVLKVASDDPHVLAWPWEALRDPYGTTLAHTCRLERQLSALHDPIALPAGLPDTQINVLLVIARPYGEEDVGFHAVSGPLVDWVHRERVAVHIDVLRPPTFAAFQQRLEGRRGYYHIVHFDGHGGYGIVEAKQPSRSRYEFSSPVQGHLVFEDAAGEADLVSATKLTTLLTEHRIPIMVLNACQSAGIDERAEDPFASTAAALLKAGIRSVVAMGYNLYVSGAQQFVPAFYRRLVQTGDVAEATRAGRKAMLENDKRTCALGEHPLQDWLVPVLYQQDAVALRVPSRTTADTSLAELPQEAQDLGDYGFIGRQDAIQQLERALLRQPAAAVLIHGMAGIGKTTLARGFLRWLQQTGGIARPASDSPTGALFVGTLWVSFEDIHSAEYVINRMVTACFGHSATALPMEQKLPALIRALREQPLLMVWDNFESVAGVDGTEVASLLVEADRAVLKDLLRQLRGGRTRILITSRSPEHWLDIIEAFRLPLYGLRGEELWTYCNAVVHDLGLKLDRSDKDCIELLKQLEGHPLALRAVLVQLQDRAPRELLSRLHRQFGGGADNESTRKIYAALALLNERLPEAFAPILQLIGLHQRYVDIDYVAHMMTIANDSPDRQVLDRCFATIERSGFIHHLGDGVYSMHPALYGFVTRARPAESARITGFVQFMARLADQLAPKALHEQRGSFSVHGANFQQALTLATQVNDVEAACALTQGLAAFAFNSLDFATASRLFQVLADSQATTHPDREAAAYHQLGIIAQEQRDFPTAECWYLKSRAIKEKHGNEHGGAITYHQLGRIAEEQRDFPTAERWYLKSLAIKEKHGNEHGAASTYHQLGIIAQEQRDFPTAERWYLKSLAIEEKLGNEHGAAGTYYQLGRLAILQRDFLCTGKRFLNAIVGFSHTQDVRYLGMALHSFLSALHSADPSTQHHLREQWKTAGMDQHFNLADLEKEFNG